MFLLFMIILFCFIGFVWYDIWHLFISNIFNYIFSTYHIYYLIFLYNIKLRNRLKLKYFILRRLVLYKEYRNLKWRLKLQKTYVESRVFPEDELKLILPCLRRLKPEKWFTLRAYPTVLSKTEGYESFSACCSVIEAIQGGGSSHTLSVNNIKTKG